MWSYNGVINIKFTDDRNEKYTKLYHFKDIFDKIPNANRYLNY